METPAAGADRVGQVIAGKYRVTRLLAEGGMGVVYQAHHTVVKRRFAIKFLRAELSQRRESLRRFQREAEAAGALENEHLAATFDFGVLPDGAAYIVMEYLEGETLAALLAREGPLPVSRATDLIVQACRGMAAAHAAGIVHRDLKPENLFVCRRDDGADRVKVLDFGVAKLEDAGAADAATRSGSILGTPAYMCPEQARGDKTIDQRADVYALGAILFELVTGQLPHPGESRNAILHHIATQPALSLEVVRPDLPAALVTAVQAALASRPDDRPASVELLAQGLAPLASSTVWPAGPAVAAPVAAATLPMPMRAVRRPVVFVALGLLALGAATWAIIARRAKPARRPFASETTLVRGTRFLVSPPHEGAVQQIAALSKAQAFADAASLTTLVSVPQALWLTGGTPEDVRASVQTAVMRASRDQRVPVLVLHDIPYRDCAQYSAGGVPDGTAYAAWIDGVAAGIGNARAVIVLEPDSLGIIPYNTALDGAAEWCKPTVLDAAGQPVRAPGSAPADRYAQLNDAVDRLEARAPNAAVYLDATHAGWLNVGEIASRLVRAGVRRAQGFIVNVSNFQPTLPSIQYATWISKCIHYANNPADGGRRLGRYTDCGSQYAPATASDYATWSRTDAWYAEQVDRAPNPPGPATPLIHFVVDTSRAGRVPLDPARFAAAPYNQPPEVIAALTRGLWCNPPGAGIGPVPTVETGFPLADAFVWVKRPGESDGSCDIAGGARAWDYERYNPWGITGDARNHFDPLWGMVDPAGGAWFPEAALQLAQNAAPAIETERRPTVIAPGGLDGGRQPR
ncbi:MAG TPA: glycoside hydrolase family 6 protein [Polyangia bacterium]|nr:glycoside hydrolase family 6 protein [Polyangia bacterium]